MCGIAGVISSNNIELSILKKMTDRIAHRGPDGEGHYLGENFGFGHRRLSIIDLSSAGHQPMTYLDRYVITYNGEIYNYPELRVELETAGYSFRTGTDTEVLMAAYDHWGTDCLNRFNGMWAFVLYDRETKKFFMSRDRFGKKPFVFAIQNQAFIFASEIKAILQYPNIDAPANIPFLKKYLQAGCKEHLPSNAFENILKFPSASYFEGSLQEILDAFQPKLFWQLTANCETTIFDQEKASYYAQQYYELLKDAVRIRLRADVQVGSALSGGLDSSSIVYLVNEILKEQNQTERQETFSTVYHTEGTEDCDESRYINALAKTLGVHSNQIEPHVSDVPVEHEKVIYYMENPPDSTCMSGWHTFKLVQRHGVKVTLDGQGADEQLAGYLPLFMNYLASLPLLLMFKEAFLGYSIPGVKRYIHFGVILGIARALLGYRFIEWVILKIKGTHFNCNLNKQLASSMSTSLINLLHYADRSSMGHSIESRMPFMDYRLVEFLATIPSCYKMHNGWTKYIARLAFDKKLPEEICWRKDKMGWPIPEQYWFSHDLKEWLDNELNSSPLLVQLDKTNNPNEETESRLSLSFLIRKLNVSQWHKLFFG